MSPASKEINRKFVKKKEAEQMKISEWGKRGFI
jgi:hypothetical protein